MEITCINCFGELSPKECISCQNYHDMCKDCFETQVHSQICPESIGEFTNNSCKIVCKYCSTKTVFTDKKVISNISEELCEQLFKIREDIASKKTELDCDKRHAENLHKSIVDKHHIFICENILTLHCTNKECNAAIFDFTGCFAIECASCKNSICGWCLNNFASDNEAHSHVKTCVCSLNQGSYYGTLEQFNQVHIKKRTKNVKKYLESIYDEKVRSEVTKRLDKDLSDLNIQLVQTSNVSAASAASAASATDTDHNIPPRRERRERGERGEREEREERGEREEIIIQQIDNINNNYKIIHNFDLHGYNKIIKYHDFNTYK